MRVIILSVTFSLFRRRRGKGKALKKVAFHWSHLFLFVLAPAVVADDKILAETRGNVLIMHG